MCCKWRYRDEVAAKLALARIQFKDKPKRLGHERRAYKCPRCRGYHLTSQAKENA